jgi:transcriptional regulator with XRE-family HTH domain
VSIIRNTAHAGSVLELLTNISYLVYKWRLYGVCGQAIAQVMDIEKRKALEAAGWRFGDAADFLDLSNEERQLLDARIEAALAVRRQRKARNLSQKQLGSRIKTSQPRVAKIERAAADVSLDQILRAFAAAGGRIVVKQVARRSMKKGARRRVRRALRTGRGDADEMQIQLIEPEA